MAARVVVLGGGVGGTLAANLISHQVGDRVDVTVVDPTGMHVYQPGFLYVALGKANAWWLSREERKLLRPAVDLIVDGAEGIDPEAGTVHLTHGDTLSYDYLVLSAGARLVPEEIPGLIEGSQDFYSMAGAQRLREALRNFNGGRIAVGIAGIPYKCPPAPVEFVLMLEEYLRHRGIREKTEIRFLSPLNRAFTIETTSKLVQPIMEERGIELNTFFNIETVDPEAHVVNSLEGESFDYDLLVAVPPHRGQKVVSDSGLGDSGGWIPVDRGTLQHEKYDRIFAIGDGTNLPISKSGSTAHFEAPVVASRIAARIEGRSLENGHYEGKVMCFLETGNGKATTIQFTYDEPPVSPNPSRLWHLAKWGFNRAYWFTVPQGRIH